MFFRTNRFQYHAKPEKSDPIYARKLQEILGDSGARSASCWLPVPGLELPGPGQVPRHDARHRHRGDRPRRDAGHDDCPAPRGASRRAAARQRRAQPDRRRRHGRRRASARTIMGGDEPAALHRRRRRAAPSDSVGQRLDGQLHRRQRQPAWPTSASTSPPSRQGRLQVCRLYEHDRGPGRPRHAQFPDRPRHDAPEPVAGRHRGTGEGRPGAARRADLTSPNRASSHDVSYQFWNCSDGAESPRADGRAARRSTARGSSSTSPTRSRSGRRSRSLGR